MFELAEDSAEELGSYLYAGRVLVARSGPQIAGHLQLTGTGQPGHAEVKNMAVREELQGQGVGRQLMQAALMLLAAEGVTTVWVATAAADIGNLRFYQRQGFRMSSVERDAFTEASGYPPGSQADGIALRDRVWLDIQLGSGMEPVSGFEPLTVRLQEARLPFEPSGIANCASPSCPHCGYSELTNSPRSPQGIDFSWPLITPRVRQRRVTAIASNFSEKVPDG